MMTLLIFFNAYSTKTSNERLQETKLVKKENVTL